jgi:FAD/FMN-containing dehydrogenase
MSSTPAPAPPAPSLDDLEIEVVAPGDPGYEESRQVQNGAIDRRPAAIVRPADANGVARIVDLARESGLDLAVRGGGHSGAGHGVCEGGIVIDLSAMRGLEIDVAGRTAWAETGLTAGEYTRAVGEHGLATGFGDAATVGIGGITLGGGVGLLARKHGLTIDDLLAAEIVTADGELVRTDADNHPDLFWAIRGGGGNFGVVTRLRFRLHELSDFTGGMLILPAGPEVLAGFVAAAQAAPEQLTAIANVMPAPPLPFVPPEQHGRLIVLGLLAFAGPAPAAERALAPFRELAEPIADMVRPMPYAEMFPAEEEERRPISALRNLFADEFDLRRAETIVANLEVAKGPMAVTQIRVLGGAMARVPNEATAFAHRDRRLMVNVAAIAETVEELPEQQAWVDRLAAALRSERGGAYSNFLGDEGPLRVREAYPGGAYERLAEIKWRWDRDNLFRLNQNIHPALPRD